jgi:hypothetical protein
MNIFYLSKDYKEAAKMHLDKHVVKMILEYAQILSTTHRVLDGEEYYVVTEKQRRIKRWKHPCLELENGLYKASHVNHPSNIWARKSRDNYVWLYKLWRELCKEYTYRYGKIHLTYKKLHEHLRRVPVNIEYTHFSQVLQAMPDKYKDTDSVVAYRRYYIHDKKDFAKWTKRDVPEWFTLQIPS